MITETGKAGQNSHVLRKDHSRRTGTTVWNGGECDDTFGFIIVEREQFSAAQPVEMFKMIAACGRRYVANKICGLRIVGICANCRQKCAEHNAEQA